ncbi:MAG: calcium/sodium antiporter [Litorilinea sp.]
MFVNGISPELLMDGVYFLAGFVLLVAGANYLVKGSSSIAARLNISAVVIGLTVVAFGTSLPELLVSVIANMGDRAGSTIAIGNIVGSNIANLGLILGVAGVIAAINVERGLIRFEFPLLVLVSLLFMGFSWNGQISRVEGIILLVGLVAFTYRSYTSARTGHAVPGLEEVPIVHNGNIWIEIFMVIGGLAGLVLGAQWLVESAESLALAAGISPLVIGLTLVAVGTSLPELATTVVAVRRNEGDIAVGNVVGSNLFNMLFIGGLASIINPIPVPLVMRALDFPIMLGFTLLVFVFVLIKPRKIQRWQGFVLLVAYFTYTIWLFTANGGPA